jgi:hypothetical protein
MNSGKLKRILWWVGIGMCLVAVVFLSIALSHPELGTVFYIGSFRVGAEVWRTFYCIYAAVALGCLVVSFFIKDKK